MRKHLVLFIGLALAAPLCSQTSKEPRTSAGDEVRTPKCVQLYYVSVDGNEGYINEVGKLMIKPQFGVAHPFHEGLAKVVPSEELGCWYIDGTGRMITEKFENCGDSFSDGLAAVGLGGKYGYIDKLGRIAIKPQFDLAQSFSEGLAGVEVGEKYGYIDRTGQFVIDPQFDYVEPFSEGLAKIMTRGAEFLGFVNRAGKTVIGPLDGVEFKPGGFSEGLAVVSVGGKFGYVDKTGSLAILPKFDYAGAFSEGRAFVVQDGKIGYINSQGQWAINPRFAFRPGSEPDAIETAIILGTYSQGLAAIRVGETWGYINKQGAFVIAPRFDRAYHFEGPLAAVQLGAKRGYIDKTGRYVWKPTE